MLAKSAEERELISKLTGTTILVYWYFLKKGKKPVGTREVMRALSFSSPSSATHHLEKLRHLGLIEKDQMGSYQLIRRVPIAWLEAYTFMFGRVIPKHFIYALITSLGVLLYLFFFLRSLTLTTIAALFPAVIGCIILWYETILLWRRRPRLE